ncbi:hypothetical protein [Amycolatopsis sp. lyj-23]|uniref:hypothetical protein n=1 Tax=Amycolatopsis sp. lyj-23 TaxID=2789283 RepID=UPI00397D0054
MLARGEVVGAPAVGAGRGPVAGGLAAVFFRGRTPAPGSGLIVSRGGAIVGSGGPSQRVLQPATRGSFPPLGGLERGIRALLPGTGVTGPPVGGEFRPPPAEIVQPRTGEAGGLRGGRAGIVRDVHPTTIPRSPG